MIRLRVLKIFAAQSNVGGKNQCSLYCYASFLRPNMTYPFNRLTRTITCRGTAPGQNSINCDRERFQCFYPFKTLLSKIGEYLKVIANWFSKQHIYPVWSNSTDQVHMKKEKKNSWYIPSLQSKYDFVKGMLCL